MRQPLALSCAVLPQPESGRGLPHSKTLRVLRTRPNRAAREALLRIPIENMDRWLANGHTAPHRFEPWRQTLIEAPRAAEGFAGLLRLLRNPGESSERLRDFVPFAGVLTTHERRQAIRLCEAHPRLTSLVAPGLVPEVDALRPTGLVG